MISRRYSNLVTIILVLALLISCSPATILQETATPTPNDEPQPQEENGGLEISGEFVNGLRLIGEGVYETEDTGVLFPEPDTFGDRQRSSLDGKIAQYNRMLADYPEINFYAFYLDLIQYSANNPLNDRIPGADAGRSLEYFMANKPDGLTLDTLPLTSFEDYLKYYFRTDHHWNVHGMLAGYAKIHKMLSKEYPEISPMYPHDKIYTFPDIEFVGTWARRLNYRARPEPFEVVILDLPVYKTYDSSGVEIDVNFKDEYLAGEYAKEFFTDHYVEYYRKSKIGFLEYISENGSDRNLLIIRDSYSNAIEPLLISHYHHTYCVDIRRLPDYYFSLSEFLSQYEVDDILFIGGASVIMYEWQWTINP